MTGSPARAALPAGGSAARGVLELPPRFRAGWAAALFLLAVPAFAEDVRDLLARGEGLRRALPAPVGPPREAWFEVFVADESVGYGSLRLAPRDATEGGWRYRHETALRLPGSNVTRATVDADLSRDFTVRRIEIAREWTQSAGGRKTVVEKAVVGPERMVLVRTEDDETVEQPASPPGHPCSTALEFLLPLIARACDRPFALCELDPETGAVTPVVFRPTHQPDGAVRLTASREGQDTGEYYLVDRTGELLEFGDPTDMLVEKRSTPERVSQIKAVLER